jgi:GDP/GTP exchange factor required for growth at low temperature
VIDAKLARSQSIVRKLIKVVKDCKEAHTRRHYGTSSARQSISTKPRPTHVLGEKFAEAISKDQDDSDVDLDFAPDERVSVFLGSGGESGNAFAFGSSGGVASPPRANAIASASTAILQQPLQRNILQQSRASISVAPGAAPLLAQSLPPITFPQRALSRVFVKTIGRLGRWRRVLNSRQTVDTGIAVPANVSAFDLELSVSGDLLGVRGGVEQYLKMIEPPSPVTSGVASHVEEGKVPSASASSHHLRSVSEVTEEEEEHTETATMSQRQVSYKSAISAVSRATLSTRTHSTESFGSILSSRSKLNPLVAQVQAQPPWQFDVVSIDDLELSDTSSELHVENANVAPPPGLRKVPRKLPLRRDFEFIRRSGESVSSMGIRSRDSVASENSAVSLGGGGLGNGIQQWQVNAIVDSLSENGEDGGVPDALKRLEGQINPQRRKENALKVDGWVRTIQERMAAGDFGDELPRFFDEFDEEEDDVYDIDQHETGSVRQNSLAGRDSLPATPSRITLSVASESEDYFSSAPASGSSFGFPLTPVDAVGSLGLSLPMRGLDTKPVPEDAVPLEILQSRVSSRPSTSRGSSMGATSPAPAPAPALTSSALTSPVLTSPVLASPTKILTPTGRKLHRSWVLNVRADVLAQHFSIIDRELFVGIKPEELIMDDWMSCREVNVLDWPQYLKDRAQWKAESQNSQKTSALAVVRGRFNLMANFVASEIVMTPPSDRHTLVAKFIRIAFVRVCRFGFGSDVLTWSCAEII